MSEETPSYEDVWFVVGSLCCVLAREDGFAYAVDTLRKNPMLANATQHLRDRLNDLLQEAEIEVSGHTAP